MYDISIENISCYAFHGCLEEESIIGGYFSVDVHIECDLREAILSDNLLHTIDYTMIHQVVKNEMSIASKLIEHVAGRIAKQLIAESKRIKKVMVVIRKKNPPVNGFIADAIVRVELTSE